MIVSYEPNRWTMDFDTVMTQYSRYCMEPNIGIVHSMDHDDVMTMWSRYCDLLDIGRMIAESDSLATQWDNA